MTVSQVKLQLRFQGLKTGGQKNDLAERLSLALSFHMTLDDGDGQDENDEGVAAKTTRQEQRNGVGKKMRRTALQRHYLNFRNIK
mmetsp:Transcript_24235/g.29372  ORF Transcript_24235/g.29372 Transcript_24235/m.29372 type:complete len:85 (-) Transcript_24235:134-388(-)